jgi:hypothetical protein
LFTIPLIGYLLITRNLGSLIASGLFVILTSTRQPLYLFTSLYPLATLSIFLKFDNQTWRLIFLGYAAIVGGILSCVKFTMFLVAFPTIISTDILLFKESRRIVTLPLFCVTYCTILLIQGATFESCVSYVSRSLIIAAGYSEAMISSRPLPGFLFGLAILLMIATLMLTFTILFVRETSKIYKALYIVCCGCSIFLAFKHGFVRHDGHVQSLFLTLSHVAAYQLIIVSFWKTYQLRQVAFFITCFLLILLGSSIVIPLNSKSLAHRLCQSWINLKTLLSQDKKQMIFEEKRNKLAIYDPVLFDNAIVDSYPWDQTEIIMSGLNYQPRPVPQSYTAYTPELLRINAESLLETGAPDYLFWQVKSIDERLPMLMDGLSWPIVLRNYAPETKGELENEILLRKQNMGLNVAPGLKLIENHKLQFENFVDIHRKDEIIWATVDVEYTWLGKLVKLFWRPPSIFMNLKLESTMDGIKYKSRPERRARFIPGMAKTPFLISPLIYGSKFADLYNIYYSDNPAVWREVVSSFSLSPTFDFSNNQFEKKRIDKIARACFKSDINIKFYVFDEASLFKTKGKRVWSLTKSDDLARTSQVKKLNFDDQSMNFLTAGKDPKIFIKELPISNNKQYSLCVKKRGESIMYQVFYRTDKSSYFNELTSCRFFSQNGKYVCTRLPHNILPQRIRLDPGNMPNRYITHEVSLFEYSRD